MGNATEKKPSLFETEPPRLEALMRSGEISWEQYQRGHELLKQLAEVRTTLVRERETEGLSKIELAERVRPYGAAYRQAVHDNEHPTVPRTGYYLRGGRWHWLKTDWYYDERGRQHARLYDHTLGAVDSQVEPVCHRHECSDRHGA